VNVDRDTVIGMRSNEAPHPTCIDASSHGDIAAGVPEFICGEDCPRPATRTAAATAGRMRASENRGADKLEGRGWACYPPEIAWKVRALVAEAGLETSNPR
jgi:hypothetical protein